MSRILPIQPPHPFSPEVWTKEQERNLVRIWQDIAAFLENPPDPLTTSTVIATTQIITPTITTTTVVAQQIGGTLYADQFLPGTTEVGAKIGAAIAALPATGGTIDARALEGGTISTWTPLTKPVLILWGAGTYNVSTPLIAQNQLTVGHIGCGPGQTIFNWVGAADGVMFRLDDVGYGTRLSGFTIQSSSSSLHDAINLRSIAGGVVTPNRRRFDNIFINGSFGAIRNGIHWDISGAGGDQNQDTDYLEKVYAITSEKGFFIEGTQAKEHIFISCTATNSQIGVYANASFTWLSGFMGSNSISDFHIGNPQFEPVLISGLHSELSGRLLETSGPTSVANAITIQNVRWQSNALNADHRVISYLQSGGLTLIGNSFGTFSPVQPMEIYVGGMPDANSRTLGGGFATGNFTVTSLVNPFTGGPWTVWIAHRNDGTNSFVSPPLVSLDQILLPTQPTGNPMYALDASGGTRHNIAASATFRPFGNNVMNGIFLLDASSIMGLFLVSSGGAVLVSANPAGYFSTVANNTGTFNIYVTSGALELQNNLTFLVAVMILPIRTG